MKTNYDVAEAFVLGEAANSHNLHTDGKTIQSYKTTIARHTPSNRVIMSGDRYSITTTQHQNDIRAACRALGRIPATFSFEAFYLTERYLDQTEIVQVEDDDYKEWVDKDGVHRSRYTLGGSILKSGDWTLLSGMDENRYYLCRLPCHVETFKEGLICLAPPEVRVAVRDEQSLTLGQPYPNGVLRQGEMFCVPSGESVTLQEGSNYAEVNKILGRHNPTQWGKVAGGEGIYVRGTLRHFEHKMLHLGKTWYKVYRNTALASWSAGGQVD